MLQVFLICVVFIFPQCKKHSHWNVWWILDKRTNVVALLGWWPFRLMCDPSPAFWARCVRAGWSVHIVLCIYVCVCACALALLLLGIYTQPRKPSKGHAAWNKILRIIYGFLCYNFVWEIKHMMCWLQCAPIGSYSYKKCLLVCSANF